MTARLLPTALLLTFVVGCAGSVEGQGGYLAVGPAGTPTTSESSPPATASETSTTEAPTTTNPPTTTSTSVPPPTSPPPAPPPSGGDQLSDDEWVVESFDYGGSAIGLFDGTARITNTASTQRSALYTFTLFDGETIVATMIGSSTDVAAGDEVTVSMISGDDFVEGEFSVDFQVDFSF